MSELDRQLILNESGAAAIEYALIASLLSVVIIGGLLLLNSSVTEMYSGVYEAIIEVMGK